MVDIDRVGRSILGKECEDIGPVAFGHANSNLTLEEMTKYVCKKIHWLPCLKYFCMCVHGYHAKKGDAGMPVIKYSNHLIERDVNAL